MDTGCLTVLIFNFLMMIIFFKFLIFLLFSPIGWALIILWILFSTFGGNRYQRKRNEEYYRNWEEAYKQYRESYYQNEVNQTNYQVEKSMKILGITELSRSSVSKAFRRLSKKYHPDICKEERSVCETIYKDITAAYEYLMEYMNSNNIN
jgi:uncharacterized membrane protein